MVLITLDTGTLLLENDEDGLSVIIVGYKGVLSVRPYVAKAERIHYLRLYGADFSKFGKFHFTSQSPRCPVGCVGNSVPVFTWKSSFFATHCRGEQV